MKWEEAMVSEPACLGKWVMLTSNQEKLGLLCLLPKIERTAHKAANQACCAQYPQAEIFAWLRWPTTPRFSCCNCCMSLLPQNERLDDHNESFIL